jgi:hypothetical protein
LSFPLKRSFGSDGIDCASERVTREMYKMTGVIAEKGGGLEGALGWCTMAG